MVKKMTVEIYSEREQISLIVFEVGWEQFSIDLLDVKEIVQSGQIRRLSKTLDFVDGIYNYRGDIIHIIDLHKKLNLEEFRLYKQKNVVESKLEETEKEKESSDETDEKEKVIMEVSKEDDKKFIIIVNINENNIGFFVDKIINVVHIKQEDLVQLSPIFQTSIGIEYIKGIVKFPDKPRILIDLGKILSESEQITIQKELSSLL